MRLLDNICCSLQESQRIFLDILKCENSYSASGHKGQAITSAPLAHAPYIDHMTRPSISKVWFLPRSPARTGETPSEVSEKTLVLVGEVVGS